MGIVKIQKLYESIKEKNFDILGGKGAHLAKLLDLKMPVPSGFVLPTTCFKLFLEKSDYYQRIQSILQNPINFENILEVSKQLQDSIMHSKFPEKFLIEVEKAWEELSKHTKIEYVAVRSSATVEDLETASFAGQAETFLCIDNLDHLYKSIKDCWASLYSPRALMYCLTNNILVDKVQMAVIVQKMVNSDIAGVMFTADVVNKDPSKILINITWGFGETIADGKVDADEILIDKDTLKILNIRIGKKELMSIRNVNACGTRIIETPHNKRDCCCITEEKIIEIAKIGLEIEKKFKYYQDIEFAIENNEIKILQSRPVTTM
ncbi:MAG: PEP/pyruvate-binding domain-containing protein [Candidatus Helarchaeota archaeon]|nr:PEP/pyruvate-binding domain-containing protein [Candidatus Helarchaeota archaeon]